MARVLLTPAQRRKRNDYMRVYMRKRYHRLKLEAARKRFWSPEAIEWLHHAYPHQPTASLALAMGRPVQTIYAKARALGISKTAEYLASPAACRLRREMAPGLPHRFPKGHVPANKGLRRPGYVRGRMAETMFKKGQVPVNLMPLQSERINADGYLDRKISLTCKGAGAWIAVHRLVWMQANGDVPKGHVLRFKDCNKMNVALDNIECLSLRDNMRRNTIHNLPAPLKEVIQLRGTLMATITKRMKREEQNRGSPQSPVRNARGAEGQGEANGDRSRKGDRGRGQCDRPIREG